ncbi:MULTISPECIES: alpha/beta hydrolase [unclassified Sinorhizobium]|uniref:alpha/beta hydrolase n=1 Tax=unclassified Sinorhizobium TaxID=2613772 RepID=UPI0024C20E44|nr:MULTISPECIES: alpha/beta hydrolase [unclassified Sinorhizobium]MDK1376428.1 alpha/beta fold hydrolase [Sinorhizobium sp. 6-70]MDK1479977.1 alpha/beta fold hydrolase [Sinorhizobium sp. 6-117]
MRSLVLSAAIAAFLLGAGYSSAQDSTPAISAPCIEIKASANTNIEDKRKSLNDEAGDIKAQIANLPDGKEKTALDQRLRRIQEKLLDLVFELECDRSDLTIQVLRGPNDPPTQWIELTTYFATNRKSTGNSAPEDFFGTERAGDNQYGKTIVSIPTARKLGDMNLPSVWRLELSPDPTKHFVFKQVVPLDATNAVSEISKAISQSKKSSLLIFVHGYNVSFEGAALRTAQLAHDLSFPGAAMFFSWPSMGTTKGYWRDEETVQLSEAAFDAFLDKVAGLGASEVYIVAHSMGNRLVTTVLRDRASKGKTIPNLRELMLAAPDINADIFREKILPGLAALDVHRTIYASSSDVALRASKVVHDYRRVGETDGGVLTFNGFETIDATAVAPIIRAFGHSYVVDSAKVLGDIADTLYLHFNADQRSLPKDGTPPAQWWVLK